MDEQDIPIDIHTNKLLDWLVSRRHVQRDWQTKILKIREKINEAIKDMPENEEITTLLTGSYINYFHCQKLIEILKKTEANSKNLFGQYSSKRMKDWLEIEKLYLKDNIYLGEAASLLLRNVNYEIPALRKQIAKTIHTKNEYERKEAEYEKLAEYNKKEFRTSCKSLGVKGDKVKKELIAKAAEFPDMNRKLSESVKSLKPAVEFYKKTVNALLDNDQEVLDMLHYVIEKGDTTIYEWKYKTQPSSIEPFKLNMEEEEEEEKVDSIDFGIDVNENENEEIDWGISTEDSEEKVTVEDATVAKGEEARTILGHPNTRNVIRNDVFELKSFLQIRIHEMNSESDGFASSLYPESYGMNTLREMVDNAQSVLNGLIDPTALHYLNITTNPRYIYQLTEKLEKRLSTAEKMLASRDFIRNQRAEIMKEIDSLNPKVDLLIEKAKELQELIEKDISAKYNGRPVYLIAGANVL